MYQNIPHKWPSQYRENLREKKQRLKVELSEARESEIVTGFKCCLPDPLQKNPKRSFDWVFCQRCAVPLPLRVLRRFPQFDSEPNHLFELFRVS